MQELNRLKETVEPCNGCARDWATCATSWSWLQEEVMTALPRASSRNPLHPEAVRRAGVPGAAEWPHDASNAILRSTLGGRQESCDWAAMLLRMYVR